MQTTTLADASAPPNRVTERPTNTSSQELLRDRETLAAMATHDLREPMQAIQSFISVILRERIGPLNETQRDFLISAYDTGRRLERLIEDVQVLILTGEGFLIVPENTDVYAHVISALRQLQSAASVYRIEFMIDGDPAADWSVWVDPLRLDQMLLNIVENAIRYSAADTHIRIRMRGTRSRLLVLVTNEAEQPPREDPAAWFAPFRRGDYLRRENRRGLGLGLTVVGYLVRAHHGRILTRATGSSITIGFALPRRNLGPPLHAIE